MLCDKVWPACSMPRQLVCSDLTQLHHITFAGCEAYGSVEDRLGGEEGAVWLPLSSCSR